MKKVILLILVFLLILSSYLVGFNHGYDSTITVSPTPYSLDQDRLFNIVNIWKTSQNSEPYIEDSRLCKLAETRLIEIEKNFSHRDFDKHSRDFFNASLGENLSTGYSSEKETFDAWLASPTHKENLDKDYSHSCIRCNNNKCVQIFAKFEL